ncbi:MAG: hypothetical protein AAGF73_12720 [Actinomycetota bacterium]
MTATGPAIGAPCDDGALAWPKVLSLFARLRWRTIANTLRGEGSQRWAILIGLAAALVAGAVGGGLIAVAGRSAENPRSLFVVAAAAVVGAVAMIGIITGVSQPIDPRVLATEPINDRRLAAGVLVASLVGPPGIGGALLCTGFFVGAVRGPTTWLPVAVAVLAFGATLLLVSRTAINLLAVLATRVPRIGQIVAGLSALVFYGSLQFIPRLATNLDANERDDAAGILQWTPPGQLGRALADADGAAAAALGRAALGAAWLIILAVVFAWSTRYLLVAVKRTSASRTRSASPFRRLVRRMCGPGAVGAVAWRGLLTRLRAPRSALETFTGAGIGLALVLVPALARDAAGGGAVLIGGAIQLAVLFMASNSFGSDGPALTAELLTGTDPSTLVVGKARSIAIVGLPLAIVGPTIAAAVTGQWRYLPAGFLVGLGGLLAGVGGAIVQSTLVPIAIPESDNPLATGDSGRGCIAVLMLAAVLTALAVITLPVALALLWALDRDSVPLVTIFGAATLVAGWMVRVGGVRYALTNWRSREPEIVAAVTPAR